MNTREVHADFNKKLPIFLQSLKDNLQNKVGFSDLNLHKDLEFSFMGYNFIIKAAPNAFKKIIDLSIYEITDSVTKYNEKELKAIPQMHSVIAYTSEHNTTLFVKIQNSKDNGTLIDDVKDFSNEYAKTLFEFLNNEKSK